MNTVRSVHVTPSPGRVVPDPDYGDTLPASGRTVARSPYWARRIHDNDVIVGEPQEAGAATVQPDEGAKE